MSKKLLSLLLVVVFVFAAIPAMAADIPAENVEFTATITVTEAGGRFQVGFANLEFKKEFLKADMLPITFEVRISAVKGEAGIEIDPSIPDFCKKVHIRVDADKGLLYDDTEDKNINVHIKKQQIIVKHFSRYAFS